MGLKRALSGAAVALLAIGTGFAAAPSVGGMAAAPQHVLDAFERLGESAPGDVDAIERGLPSSAGYAQALAQARATSRTTAASDPALASRGWTFLGPSNIGGRITSLAVDPAHSGTVYVGSATGGVWKTTNAGTSLTSIWPNDQTQAIGAVALAPDGTLFAGTGEAGPGGGSLTYGGTGVYRSKDAGKTWQFVGLPGSGAIGKIVVAPGDSKVIWLAATGNLFRPGGERGLYKSTDGGDTWTLSLAGANATTGAIDIAVDPTNANNVLVAMWDHHRTPDLRTYNGVGSAVYRSTNAGGTWTRVTTSTGDPTQIGRITLAMAPSLPNVVYALINTSSKLEGFYRSVDGGATFTTTPVQDPVLTQSMTSYGWWFGTMAVDPIDPLRIITGGLLLIESVDGGLTWTPEEPTVHSDQHHVVFDPSDPTRVYVGHDGGLSISSTRGVIYSHSPDAPFMQFYSIDVSQQDPARVVGGAQDNGSLRSWGGSDWNSYGGGDGQRTLINYQNQDVVYACSQYGACTRSTNGGTTNTAMHGTSDRWGWTSPIELDPVNPSTMYWGGNRLNRSTDGGATWTAISPDLSGGPGHDPVYTNFGTITTMAAGPMASGFIIVGTDDGRVQTTTDGGTSWTRATDPHLPKTWVTRVAIDEKEPNTVYATFSGYRLGVQAPHVMRSRDRGRTWEDISGDLPNAPVNKILSLGGGLIVGTDVGVYLSRDGGLHWLTVGGGLPQAPIHDLRYQGPSQSLYAGTFGRGVWKVSLPLSLIGAAQTPVPAPTPPVNLPNTSAAPGAPAFLLFAVGIAAVMGWRRRRRAA